MEAHGHVLHTKLWIRETVVLLHGVWDMHVPHGERLFRKIDRSPTGSGVTARVATQYHKHQIKLGMFTDIVYVLSR